MRGVTASVASGPGPGSPCPGGSAAEPAASATQQLAAQRYVDAAAALCRALEGHLDDEESLVVPLLLEHRDY
jgi:hypothetical protein